MKKCINNLIIFLMSGWGVLFPQNDLGVGNLPLDWSGHWGIYHRFGFPGWGQDFIDGPLFFDGTFIYWPARYSFPFSADIQFNEGSDSETGIWYRRGDYLLDDFALDMQFKRSKDQFFRFEGMKRNFEGAGSYFGPVDEPGGTIQQNYKIIYNLNKSDGTGWDLALGFFKTGHSIPEGSARSSFTVNYNTAWAKGMFQSDKILTMGINRSYHRGNFHGVINFGLFSQRLQLISESDLPGWKGDIISYRLVHEGVLPLSLPADLTTHFYTKQSYLDSDSLGFRIKREGAFSIGYRQNSKNDTSKVQLGLGFAGEKLNWIVNGRLSRNLTVFTLFLDLNREFVNLPYQMSGAKFRSDPVYVTPNRKATSQVQTRILAGIRRKGEKGLLTIGVFQSMTSPHYYFQSDRTISLKEKDGSAVQGGVAKFRWNYFRNWWLLGEGSGFFHIENGWGHGFQHQAEISLTFQELVLKNRLDARLRLWMDIWSSRISTYVWDPAIFIDYYNKFENGLPENQGTLNLEIKGIVSSRFEISYTMINLVYFLENYTGRKIVKGETGFIATPFFPQLGRQIYLTIRWNLSD